MTEAKVCPGCAAELADDAPHGICPQCLLRSGLGEVVRAGGPSRGGATTPFPAPFSPPDPAELAPHFPQLEILELLGQGGMGAVYKARQVKLDRLVAVKILAPQVKADPAFAERFGREARALARLSHPHVVAVHDFGEAGGYYYLIMEFVDGPNLRQLLDAGPLGPAEVLALVPEVCDALQYAHDEGVVHRDIKPENILLDQKGRVKIADFGLARLRGSSVTGFSLTGSREVMGTLYYMAPEQVERPREVDHRADVYSLGVVFYEMLTGELPVGRFALPSQKAAVDARLDEVVLRALEKDPDRRYQQVSELRAEVEAFADGVSPVPRPARAPGGPRREADREAARLKAQGLAFGLLVGGALECVVAVLFPFLILLEELDGGPRHLGRAAFAAGMMGIMFLSRAVVVLLGGIQLRRLRAYEFVLLCCVVGMIPMSPAALITLPLAIWTFVKLLRSDLKSAFEGKGAESVAPPAPPPGPRLSVWRRLGSLVRSLPYYFLPSRVGPSGAQGLVVSAERPRQAAGGHGGSSPPVPGLMAAFAGGTTPQPSAPPRAGGRRWLSWSVGIGLGLLVFGATLVVVVVVVHDSASMRPAGAPYLEPEPPVLDPKLAKKWELDGDQVQAVNHIFQVFYREYLRLESLHVRPETPLDATHKKVTIQPFTQDVKMLEDRVYSQLAGLLGQHKDEEIRRELQLYGFLFPFGREIVTIEVWHIDGTYHWMITRRDSPFSENPKVESGKGPDLPDRIRRLSNFSHW